MAGALSKGAIARYRTDGYHYPVAAFSTEDAADLRRNLEAVEAAQGGPLKGRYRARAHLLFPFLQDVIRHPTILDAVEDLVGPDILCWTSNLFVKERRDPSFVPWHQDAAYWGLDSSSGVTAWVALSDSAPANGNMKVVPGTHRELVAHQDSRAEDSALPRGQEVPVEIDESRVVQITLRAGEMSLHHPLIHHGSGPNTSDDRRIGLAIRYIPTSAQQLVADGDAATLVRGEDTFGHFELEPRPSCDWDPPMVALHEELSRRSKERADRARREWSAYSKAFQAR